MKRPSLNLGTTLLVTTLALSAVPPLALAQAPTPAIPGFFRCDVAVPQPPNTITAGDFDRDGNPDLAIVSNTHSRVFIRLTDRNLFDEGDCIAATQRGSEIILNSVPTGGIAAGDIDLNNTIDLAIAVQEGVVILRGDGSGSFTPLTPIAAGSGAQVVAIADVDGDGLQDLAVGTHIGDGVGVTILYGQSSGGFTPPPDSCALPACLPVDAPINSFVVEDLNKDSFVDIAAATASGKILVFLQNRMMPRQFRQLRPVSVGVNPTALGSGDFNQDGTPDLAVTSGTSAGELEILLSRLPDDESNPFVESDTEMTGSSPSALGVEVLNRLFPLYVVVADQADNTLPFFVSNGDGTVSKQPGNCGGAGNPCTTGSAPASLVLADVDGDGRSDVITANTLATSMTILLSSMPEIPTSTPSSTGIATPTPTPTMGGDCCSAHAGPGCGVSACSTCVCGLDPPCCNGVWDNTCVQDVMTVCAASCPSCGTPTETPTITVSPAPTVTLTPTVTPEVLNDCCQCPLGQGSMCGPASGPSSCGSGCTFVSDATCVSTGACATHTPTASPTAGGFPTPTPSPSASPAPMLTATPTPTPSVTLTPTITPPNDCCQCPQGQGSTCGPAAGVPSCATDCAFVSDATCMSTGQCATHTPTATPTPTRTIMPTLTGTPTPTPSGSPTRTPIFTQTPTGTPQCVAGICISGQSCAVVDPAVAAGGGGWFLVLPLPILWLARRRVGEAVS